VARRTRRQKPFWTKRKVRGVVGVGLVVWIVLALQVPATTYDSVFGTKRLTIDGTYTLHVPGLPPVAYSADINYTTTGDFSVGTGNPIHMAALVYGANRSDFASLFQGIGLLFQEVQVGSTGTGAVPQFQPAGQGRWTADGNVDFHQMINFTGPVLSPVPGTVPSNASLANVILQVTSQVKAYNYSFPTLQPQSYTNTLVDEEAIVRYGAAGSAIILVFLLPVFDAVLLPKSQEVSGE
jgi:hypothetical protein